MTTQNKKDEKKKTVKCLPHDYQYQLMVGEDNSSYSTSRARRILFCKKCGDIKNLEIQVT